MKCFVTFRLRAGVSEEEYLDWFRRENLPAARQLKGIANYRVWRIVKVHEGQPTWEYVEEMEVLDLAECEREFSELPVMQDMLARWRGFVTDQSVVFTEELPQD